MTNATALKGQTVLFTGKLASATRRQAHALVESAGGVAVDNLSKKVTLVVVGMLGWALLPDGSVSDKLLKAEAMQQGGHSLEIISEAEFMHRLGQPNNTDIHKNWQASGSVAQAAHLLQVEETQIRRWGQFGLIHIHEDQVDFQDLVSLRAIIKWIHDGLSTKQLAKAMAELQRMVPDLQRPLAQARLLHEHGQEIVVELQGIKMTTHGQLLLDFDAPSRATPKPLVKKPTAEFFQDAEDLLEQGLQYEEQLNWTEARNSYQQALAIKPDIPEAHFYLANVFFQLHDYKQAVQYYQQAVSLHSEYADAWYNLGSALEELNQSDQAIQALKKVISIDTGYADAYFNLARLLVKAGKPHAAVEHWKHYLDYDTTSEWAKIAKRQVLCYEIDNR